MAANNTDSDGKTALQTAAEFIKYMLALSTGTLVFSAELLSEKIKIVGLSKYLLIVSWFFMLVSIIAGVLSYSRIPVQLAKKNYDLEDKWLVIPGKIHQICFLVGVLCLGVTLVTTLLTQE